MLFKKYKTTAIGLTACICFLLVYSSCFYDDKSKPNLEYMPDMYRSPSYETYSSYQNYSNDSVKQTGITARTPVEGTVPRGFLPYPYSNTNDGYEMAGQNLKNPIIITQEVVDQGKLMYTKFCVHCHGDKGDGNGMIVANGKFPAQPPSYMGDVLMALPVGKMFHTLEFGKGMMGSHASQISQQDRWKIISYITTVFQGRTKIGEQQMAVEMPKAEEPKTETKKK